MDLHTALDPPLDTVGLIGVGYAAGYLGFSWPVGRMRSARLRASLPVVLLWKIPAGVV